MSTELINIQSREQLDAIFRLFNDEQVAALLHVLQDLIQGTTFNVLANSDVQLSDVDLREARGGLVLLNELQKQILSIYKTSKREMVDDDADA